MISVNKKNRDPTIERFHNFFICWFKYWENTFVHQHFGHDNLSLKVNVWCFNFYFRFPFLSFFWLHTFHSNENGEKNLQCHFEFNHLFLWLRFAFSVLIESKIMIMGIIWSLSYWMTIGEFHSFIHSKVNFIVVDRFESIYICNFFSYLFDQMNGQYVMILVQFIQYSL